MNRYHCILATILTAVVSTAIADDRPGFTSLLNGKDLTGWKVPEGDGGHWKVVDGVIDYDASSEAAGNKSLWTEESFGDFVLRLEWRFKRTSGLYPMPTILPDGSLKTDADGKVIKIPTPNADSGILLRGNSQVNLWCWPVGSGELWSVRNDKSLPAELRAAAVPKVHADKPVGQWNAMEITMKGDRVTVVLNGQKVIDGARMPGVVASGPIGLQHHGGPAKGRPGEMSPASSMIQFRGVSIKRLGGSPAADQDGFTTLFDGKNLDRWITGPGKPWVIEDGLIALKREMDGGLHNAGYLWTRETYGDFVLDLEYKIPERANSGVFIRTADLNDPVFTGIEIQVANSFGQPTCNRGGTAGAVYDCVAPIENAVKKPGQWNQCRITCRDNRIEIVLNGRPVVDMDLDRWTKPNENPDGSKNKFPTAMKDFARTGHIGLQDHGRPVWYRNIRVKRLEE